jgi:hypothetical protein
VRCRDELDDDRTLAGLPRCVGLKFSDGPKSTMAAGNLTRLCGVCGNAAPTASCVYPHGWRLPSRNEAIRDAASARRASDPSQQNISAMWSDSSTGVALPKTYEGVAVFKKDDIKPGGPV